MISLVSLLQKYCGAGFVESELYPARPTSCEASEKRARPRGIPSQNRRRTISVSADSPTAFAVSVPSGNKWLTVSPSSGTTPATLTFAVNTAGLQSGSYDETVTVYAQQPDGPPVPMRINVTPSFAR
jgi:hypothetical protein